MTAGTARLPWTGCVGAAGTEPAPPGPDRTYRSGLPETAERPRPDSGAVAAISVNAGTAGTSGMPCFAWMPGEGWAALLPDASGAAWISGTMVYLTTDAGDPDVPPGGDGEADRTADGDSTAGGTGAVTAGSDGATLGAVGAFDVVGDGGSVDAVQVVPAVGDVAIVDGSEVVRTVGFIEAARADGAARFVRAAGAA